MTEHGKYSGVVDIARNGVDEVIRIVKEVDRLTQRVAELEAELDEQCRLNGMGSEREARLLARVEEVTRERNKFFAMLIDMGICVNVGIADD